MSEVFDNQMQTISNLQESLKEQSDKPNLRFRLTTEETKRLKKLEGIADKLKRGEHVQNRQLQTWLSEQEYEQLESLWESQKELREYLNHKPEKLKDYEDKLKQATLMDNRRRTYYAKGNKQAAVKCDNKCESLCEEALEVLQEMLDAEPHLREWFDRGIDLEEHGGAIDASLGNLPRPSTSRSIETQHIDRGIMTKREVKKSVVERAIASLRAADSADSEEEKARDAKTKEQLRGFLDNLA